MESTTGGLFGFLVTEFLLGVNSILVYMESMAEGLLEFLVSEFVLVLMAWTL